MCEDPEHYAREYGKDHRYTLQVQDDFNLRTRICEKASSRYDPAWWSFVHHCEVVAVFLLFPFVKWRYPELCVYLYSCINHVVIISAPYDMPKERVIEYYRNHQTQEFFFQKTRDIEEPCVFDIIGFTIEDDLECIVPRALHLRNRVL